ncbi:MAG TPA: ankyrin repeat domain-containing protein [Pyrinomonadaceae bacterium]|nr:ankyrin repeat domain-containing protein [Pyrinomonadaceae bacterium]
MRLLVCVWIISGLTGCTAAGRHPQRCKATNYFGEQRSGTDEGYSPACYKLQSKLIKAAGEGNLVDIREALKDGANPNLPVDDSFPPLQTAAASGQTEAVRLLLDSGSQVNQISDFENTPLNAAAASGHSEVVKVLLERGANACYRSAAGTAGDIARSKGHGELAAILKTAERAKCK